MNIRQLRAGNLVTTNGKPAGTTNGNVYKILDTNSANRLDELELIGGATIEILDGEYRTTVGAWLDYLEPIEITDEILKKLSFSKRTSSYNINIKSTEYDIIVSNLYPKEAIGKVDYNIVILDRNIIMCKRHIKYLHTLQNLIFDMTDLELYVENLISK